MCGLGMCARNGAESTPQELRGQIRRTYPGPAQFQLRALEAALYFRSGGRRIEAHFRSDRPWAD
eukprot:10326546-Alexandrium_andersonii.AAC.1